MALTRKDASIVMGMVARGDKDHDIAAWFGENQGRIAEIKAGSYGDFGILPAAPDAELPPTGAPGVKGKRLRAFVAKAIAALEGGDTVESLNQLQLGLQRYDQRET